MLTSDPDYLADLLDRARFHKEVCGPADSPGRESTEGHMFSHHQTGDGSKVSVCVRALHRTGPRPAVDWCRAKGRHSSTMTMRSADPNPIEPVPSGFYSSTTSVAIPKFASLETRSL